MLCLHNNHKHFNVVVYDVICLFICLFICFCVFMRSRVKRALRQNIRSIADIYILCLIEYFLKYITPEKAKYLNSWYGLLFLITKMTVINVEPTALTKLQKIKAHTHLTSYSKAIDYMADKFEEIAQLANQIAQTANFDELEDDNTKQTVEPKLINWVYDNLEPIKLNKIVERLVDKYFEQTQKKITTPQISKAIRSLTDEKKIRLENYMLVKTEQEKKN